MGFLFSEKTGTEGYSNTILNADYPSCLNIDEKAVLIAGKLILPETESVINLSTQSEKLFGLSRLVLYQFHKLHH